jgi:hypothetical protein
LEEQDKQFIFKQITETGTAAKLAGKVAADVQFSAVENCAE